MRTGASVPHYVRGRRRGGGFYGADELSAADDSALTYYGIVPMGIAVVAGFWMAFH